MITTKILDNTTIVSSIYDISSINLIEKCSKYYNIVTSVEVYTESLAGPDIDKVKRIYKNIQIQNLIGDEKYNSLIQYMEDNYPYLHAGEISSLIISILLFELKNNRCVYVTDDKRVKKVVYGRLKTDTNFFKLIGASSTNVPIVTTEELIKYLYTNKVLSISDINIIKSDLKNSTYSNIKL